ncbi:hypothetical protein DITRI_Ditri03aG0057700 [Diplodiscus trichospermus]
MLEWLKKKVVECDVLRSFDIRENRSVSSLGDGWNFRKKKLEVWVTMVGRNLRQQIEAMKQSFFDEEILDEQFTRLEQLEDRDNPNFVEEVLSMYFRDSTALLATLEQAMEAVPIDFPEVDRLLTKLKGSSASVGANKVRNEVNKTLQLWQERNVEGAKAAFQELRREHDSFKAKLEPYFQQLRLLAGAGPSESAMP